MRAFGIAGPALACLVGGFLAGSAWKEKHVSECEARAGQLERERDQVRSQRGSQLASALVIASRGLDQARRDTSLRNRRLQRRLHQARPQMAARGGRPPRP